ncbi:hypothetical protein JQ629_22885 [Bradyrhizobium sp. AUGA SZCCT0222]|uniref:hypothetical protein n=1 Tax=Bradyrhizobium sp. AUGA SZCCT0222 TaxID=2807668 RepID=UPI001BAA4C21|nr:hypothetical protein [Bradyrhizobium sp. AUGA SZCCT0222]MBR1270325.1 hypothetical protein [Bradyrhizobium sp. AUGA SZCCT0222]
MQRGIQAAVPDDLYPGANWSESISRKLIEADLVIGVLTSERRSQWVLFELGQAAALGRQIVLIAPPKLAAVPSHLKRFLVIRGGPKNRDAINFTLDQILASPERPNTQQPITPPSRPALGSHADSIIRDLRAAIASNDYRGVERVVVQALRGSGADIVSEATNPDLGADIAVWSDELQPFVGNPLLIEVKSRFRGTDDLRRAANQLFEAITSRGGAWGLLLYGEGPEYLSASPKGLPPTILVYSIVDLVEQLRTRSFAEVVRDLRNRRVHGGER